MKGIKEGWMMVLVVSALCIILCLFAPKAKAGVYYDDGNLMLNVSSYGGTGGMISSQVSADVTLLQGVVTYASTSLYPHYDYSYDPKTGAATPIKSLTKKDVTFYFGGALTKPTSLTLPQGQSLTIDKPEYYLYESANYGVRDQNDGGGKGIMVQPSSSDEVLAAVTPVTLQSYGSASFYSYVNIVSTPSFYYHEYLGTKSTDPRNWYGYVDFTVEFPSGLPKGMAEEYGVTVGEMPAAVPEPSSIAFVGFGAIGLIGRRRK